MANYCQYIKAYSIIFKKWKHYQFLALGCIQTETLSSVQPCSKYFAKKLPESNIVNCRFTCKLWCSTLTSTSCFLLHINTTAVNCLHYEFNPIFICYPLAHAINVYVMLQISTLCYRLFGCQVNFNNLYNFFYYLCPTSWTNR